MISTGCSSYTNEVNAFGAVTRSTWSKRSVTTRFVQASAESSRQFLFAFVVPTKTAHIQKGATLVTIENLDVGSRFFPITCLLQKRGREQPTLPQLHKRWMSFRSFISARGLRVPLLELLTWGCELCCLFAASLNIFFEQKSCVLELMSP